MNKSEPEAGSQSQAPMPSRSGRLWHAVRAPLGSVRLGGRILAVAALATGGLATLLYREVGHVVEEARLREEADRGRIERLGAVSRYQSRRRLMVETIAREVERSFASEGEGEGEGEGASDASRDTAELILAASEKYPVVDPLLLASVGIADTKLGRHGRSRSNATDILHRPPESVAKEYAERLGWESEEALLDDSTLAAELAARHLGELQRHYNDLEMVLAEYHGGPLNAGYMRARVGRLSTTTKRYVPEVIEIYQRLNTRIDASARDAEENAVRKRGADPDPGRSAARLPAERSHRPSEAATRKAGGIRIQTDYGEEEQPRKESSHE